MAQALPGFDFTQAQDVQGWEPAHDVARLQGTPEGLLIEISGNDPYIVGPARDYPAGQPLWLSLRLKSEQAGGGQVFYFPRDRGPSEENSVRFPVKANEWVDVRVPMPPLGPGYRLRLDPPGTGGKVLVASLRFEPRIPLTEPQWPQPVPPALEGQTVTVQSGGLEIVHARSQYGGFAVRVDGQPMAIGFTRPLIGYAHNGAVRWLPLAEKAQVRAEQEQDGIRVRTTVQDEDGADWEIRQRFVPAGKPGAVDVQTDVTVSQDRAVVFLPMLVILPGAGAFGTTKHQALFAGLEYLDKDEPSSSEADIIGPGSKRQVPDSERITFPLMAIQNGSRYVGLIWEKQPEFSALFDSPDRLFHSGGHVLGVLFPGSNGSNRAEGSLLPYEGATLAAGKPLTLHATLIGGKGESVVPAVQQYVALRGLPPIPDTGLDLQGYVALASAGWLDSKIREDGKYRHAYPGGFQPQPAADAALMMDWLALQSKDAALTERLRAQAKETLAQVPPQDYNSAGVSHIRYPVPALVYGHAAENATQARAGGRSLLSRFEPDGSVLYHKSPDGPDFGKTHFAPDANGLTSQVVLSLLQAAAASGDPDLTREGLRVLRALDKFANTVPRGAQTWEVPLHTPDILASAHLVHAYTLGYELTGDTHFLEQARYWAWTGVPFVYLVKPTDQPIGPYASPPVFGATHWVAPNWMGLPVQWCALVYADGLYRLHRYDSTGPWQEIADGITASGIQQTWPVGSNAERQGLLPDSFNLTAQIRNDAAINPGTVLANAVRFYHRPALYDYHVFRGKGLIVHAPGTINVVQGRPDRVAFAVQGWPDHPYDVLIVGLKSTPRVRINGQETALAAPHHYLAEEGRLILHVQGTPTIEVLTE
ncbi:MAG TPA: hypothetical protein VFB38_21710 [Chthonomonadaceae bacterium]|nr:hypothetical protein [Chthonomonadaceae bacterium]